MELIYKGIFGSRLFGTATPNSDTDYKQIHKSSLESIVLGNSLDNINNSTNVRGRNSANDVDFESKELRVFINDCLYGQTYALDLLFTPSNLWEITSPTWNDLIANREKLLTNKLGPFLGYCRGQSMKYSMKGDKLRTLHTLLDRLKKSSMKITVGEFFDKNPDLLELPYIKGYYKKVGKGDSASDEKYYDIVQGSAPATRMVLEIMSNINLQIKNYGKRAEDAMKDNGIDLKAYYHALRICWELEEYITTREIVFPSKKVDVLLNIRLGKYDKEYVEQLINDEINRVMKLENNLPNPDFAFWNDWILEQYIGKK